MGPARDVTERRTELDLVSHAHHALLQDRSVDPEGEWLGRVGAVAV
jgi:hypothetical protein